MWVINCCVLTYIYIYYYKQQRPASTCRKQTISVSPRSRIRKAIKCQAVTKIIATASPWLLLDWCSNQYLNKLLIIASRATELQYLKIAYQSEFEVRSNCKFFLTLNISNPLTSKILGTSACSTINTMWASIYNNYAVVCIHGNLKYIYIHVYVLEVKNFGSLCLELHLNCFFY